MDAEQVGCSGRLPADLDMDVEKLKIETREDMDAEEVGWSGRLPAELEANIQARLPLQSLMQSRLVCKAWNAAVASPAFLEERLISRAGESSDCMLFVVGISHSRIASCFYNPTSDRWHRHPLPAWLQALRETDSPKGMLELRAGGGSRSTSGGLLLSTMYMQEGRKVVIPHMGNPMANSWMSLPPLPRPDLRIQHVLGVFVDARARRFSLVAMYETRTLTHDLQEQPLSTFVFDSAVGRWSKARSGALVGRQTLNSTLSDHQGVFVHSVLYCVAGDCDDHHCNLLAYDLAGARWSWFVVSMPSETFDILYCNLVNVQDRLLCMALGRDVEEGREIMCLQVWVLNFAGMTWIHMDTMPAPMWTHFLGTWRWPEGDKSFRQRYVSLRRIKFKVVALPDSQVYIMNEELNNVVHLDMRQTPTAWRWLAPWPYNHLVRKSLHCLDPCLHFGSW